MAVSSVLLLVLALAPTTQNTPRFTELVISSSAFLSLTAEEVGELSNLTIERMPAKDRERVAARISRLPKLRVLKFSGCDLAALDRHCPVSSSVTSLVVEECDLTQDTMDWLRLHPAGFELVFGGCDLRNVKFTLGKLKWVAVDNCKLTRKGALQLLEASTQVTFKQCEFSGDAVEKHIP